MNTTPMTTVPTTIPANPGAGQAPEIANGIANGDAATPGTAADAAAPFACVRRVQGVRIRQEREDGYLLYQPTTDELHLLDARGMAVFELCDGRSIDDVVAEGARLLPGDAGADGVGDRAEREVFAFLQKLQTRRLVDWT
ncbi:MAG: PqqD family peptide modification chaperone [Pseudomonadota bacterium]